MPAGLVRERKSFIAVPHRLAALEWFHATIAARLQGIQFSVGNATLGGLPVSPNLCFSFAE